MTNVTATQRAGSKLVDITYDLSGAFLPYTVMLSVSESSSSDNVEAPSVTGDVGAGVAAGSANEITWDGGADADGQHSNLTFVVTAEPGSLPGDKLTLSSIRLLPYSRWRPGIRIGLLHEQAREVSWSQWKTVRDWAANNGYDLSNTGMVRATTIQYTM